ncbi:PilW family protein [Algiphilus aromaticivorans]|uniref:PilW family protein n=1 Tax=Algiphilus aromaticivorans TaxID=382454 RepID=UPI0005C185F5|nr:PilW family protein [Algiphilus aromaticivorans]
MSRHRQAGLTLVELMIALVLGLVLIGGALQVLQSTKQSYRLQENMSRLQENGRFAIEMLARDLRMAGFSQCGAMEDIAIHNNVKGDSGGADPAFDFDAGDSLSDYTPEGALANSDALRLQRADERSMQVAGAENPGKGGKKGGPNNANLKVAGNALGLEQDDVVTVTNCREGDTFRITNKPKETSDPTETVTLAHAANANTSPKLNGSYAEGDRLLRIRQHGWFVAETGVQYADGKAATALHRDIGEGPEAIVEGVRDMRLRYGVDDDGDGSVDRYQAGTDVADWRGVVAVRVSLLLETPDNYLADSPSSVIFGNAQVTAEDRRVLRVFTTTVALRNRAGGGGL